MTETFDIVILGLTITSSWGNGHATTWRSLIHGLSSIGYRVLFLERDVPWYAENRDDPQPQGAATLLYNSVDELISAYEAVVASAKLVIVGSFVPDGVAVGEWVTSVARGKTAFYDIDTPITLEHLEQGTSTYLSRALIKSYDAYFSFTGGATLSRLQNGFGAKFVKALYCSVDTEIYTPRSSPCRWDLGYLGTYSEDRQPSLHRLLVNPACELSSANFVVAGPQYPDSIEWPRNVQRIAHLSPREHPAFYSAQRFTLNVTRDAMKRVGYSPSVRLFEAAACGTPVVSDWWEGLDTLLKFGEEILIASDTEDVLRILHDLDNQSRLRIADAARRRILAEHTSVARANQLRSYLHEMPGE